jgi:hypothetical protein
MSLCPDVVSGERREARLSLCALGQYMTACPQIMQPDTLNPRLTRRRAQHDAHGQFYSHLSFKDPKLQTVSLFKLKKKTEKEEKKRQ